jgi:hypothetical protein
MRRKIILKKMKNKKGMFGLIKYLFWIGVGFVFGIMFSYWFLMR